MKQKYHLISSIVSMVLTSILLVFIVMAWYVTNTEVSVTGVSGSTALIEDDGESMVVSVEYYYIQEINGNTYTIGEPLSGISSNFELKPYNALSETPHQILLKINLSQSNLAINARITDSLVHEKLKTVDANGVKKYIFMGSKGNDNKPIKEIEKDGNQLSSIISFYYITNVENNQFTVGSEDEVSFVVEAGKTYDQYLDDNIIISSDTGDSEAVYIMFDYVEGAIEDIYSANLGSNVLNPVEDPSDPHWMDVSYKCDFKISVSKASGGDE